MKAIAIMIIAISSFSTTALARQVNQQLGPGYSCALYDSAPKSFEIYRAYFTGIQHDQYKMPQSGRLVVDNLNWPTKTFVDETARVRINTLFVTAITPRLRLRIYLPNTNGISQASGATNDGLVLKGHCRYMKNVERVLYLFAL